MLATEPARIVALVVAVLTVLVQLGVLTLTDAGVNELAAAIGVIVQLDGGHGPTGDRRDGVAGAPSRLSRQPRSPDGARHASRGVDAPPITPSGVMA
jgi:hypothetical protein